ncbi:DUF6354 family protein [Streptomyces sp. NPDC058268]|uniref:DUF6354 family protein n=1 Tax=Streptomyces sp. NPDC058268 TaxID=3346413 RepID=UPI0036EF9809
MTEVAVGQVWRDMAKDMIDRDRRLRVTGIDGDRATCIVDHDAYGTAGKTVKIATARFGTASFQLVEDSVPETDRDLYTQLLTAMSGVHGSGTSPAEYARAALRVVRAAS